MKEKTFIEKCVDKEIEDPEEIHDYIDKWHNEEGENETLAQFLGMSLGEYKGWVENKLTVKDIIRNRCENQIAVTITGPEKLGSTTVGNLLARALAAHNIPCEVDDSEGDYRERFFGDRIHAIQENPPLVKIKTTSNK